MLRAMSQGGAGTFTTLTVTGTGLFADGTVAAPSIAFAHQPGPGLWRPASNVIRFPFSGSTVSLVDSSRIAMGLGTSLVWRNAIDPNGAIDDLILLRDGATTLAQRNGVNAQTLVIGQGNVSLAAGRLQMGRDAAAAFAPGAGRGMLR